MLGEKKSEVISAGCPHDCGGRCVLKVHIEDGKPVMEALKRISKPGRREYVPADKVASVMGGVGITILSTSKGLLTDAKAREEGIGGEAICTIW